MVRHPESCFPAQHLYTHERHIRNVRERIIGMEGGLEKELKRKRACVLDKRGRARSQV